MNLLFHHGIQTDQVVETNLKGSLAQSLEESSKIHFISTS